jgi:hypothetical protein
MDRAIVCTLMACHAKKAVFYHFVEERWLVSSAAFGGHTKNYCDKNDNERKIECIV